MGAKIVKSVCAKCHSLEKGRNGSVAPSLWGVFKPERLRPAFNYSSAMLETPAVWTQERLEAFLANPGKSVPGTTMRGVYVPPDVIPSVVRALATLSSPAP